MSEVEIVAVQTTVGDEATADELAGAIIEEQLAACVQCLPVKSTYRWKGAVKRSQEFLLLAKTRADRCGELTAFIKRRHPYELPEIIVTPVAGGLAEYLTWVSETAGDREPSE